MRKREYSQISFDDLLGVPTAGEIVESHEWFRAVRVLKAVVTPDGERRLICERGKGLCYLRDGVFLLKNKYRGSGGCLPEFSLEVYSV